MKPLRMTLNGFKGIDSGLGKNEITLDLESIIPAEAQLVALSAPNGGGKTTIMDNLHPYRLMPSHASSMSPAGFSYFEHIVGGDAHKELDWEHGGRKYRSVIRLKVSPSGKTKKQECYLFAIDGPQPEPWKEPSTGLTSDGKAENYDACVEAILGSPEAFFTAQFSAQSKRPVGAMAATEVKKLFSSMLGYEELLALASKANDTYKELRPFLSEAQDRLMQLTAKRPNAELINANLQDLNERRMSLHASRTQLREQCDEAMRTVAKLATQVEQQESIKSKISALDERLADAVAGREKQLGEIDAKHGKERADLESELSRSRQSAKAAGDLVTDLSQRIAAVVATLQKQGAIDKASARREELLAKRGTLVIASESTQLDALKVAQARNAIQELTLVMKGDTAEGKSLAEALALAQKTAALLSEVPCHGTDMAGRCKLLGQANQAAGEIPQKLVALENARSEMGKKIQKRQTMMSHFDKLVAAEAAFNAAKEQIAALDAEMSDLREILALRPQFEEAQAALPNLKMQKEAAEQRHGKEVATQSELEQRHAGLKQEQDKQRSTLVKSMDEVIATLVADRAALPKVISMAAVDEAKANLNALVEMGEAKEELIFSTEIKIAEAKREMAGLAELDGLIARAKDRADAISAEMAHWKLLGTAMGTNGIIAMSIDDAGPAIAEKANQLLEDCYGGRFSLAILTQEETAGGIQKETFQIQVLDNHRGETKLIDFMSGGEKVWINECLVRGIALHLAEASGKQFQTLFADEADGPLDPDRKRQFMSMKRAVLARGGYDREYIVTQTPELVELCDAVIDVTQL